VIRKWYPCKEKIREEAARIAVETKIGDLLVGTGGRGRSQSGKIKTEE